MLILQRASCFGTQLEKVSKEDRGIVVDRIEKELVAVIRDSELARQRIVFGIRQVQKSILDHSAGIVIFTQQSEASLFNHIPLLCRLHSIPICILQLSSDRLGKLFAMKTLTMFAIKANYVGNETSGEKMPAEYKQELSSLVKFLCSKASKKV
uniref:Uncharacterized protein AlNc14C102G6098 n=1 Tax=Albugo laibachii Nc14 TaxID=890382 RepID=F0WHM3_9STRA|nr:conserved hypothetical protein [Albugo laibachii Nc14]|eukprot:CCA20766.1 conserved hypothetical protein [Albugo laibachii Nc14]